MAANRFLGGSREGLKRLTGVLPTYEGELIGQQVSGWSLSRLPDGRYYVYHEKYPYFYGFIETYGKGEPRLLQWTPMKGAWRGIGQLRYFAGMKGEGEEAISLEYTAIFNMKKARLAAIEPYQWGKKQAKWKWGNGSVTITDPDGMASEVVLKKALAVSAASRRRKARRRSVSSPWGDSLGAIKALGTSKQASKNSCQEKTQTPEKEKFCRLAFQLGSVSFLKASGEKIGSEGLLGGARLLVGELNLFAFNNNLCPRQKAQAHGDKAVLGSQYSCRRRSVSSPGSTQTCRLGNDRSRIHIVRTRWTVQPVILTPASSTR